MSDSYGFYERLYNDSLVDEEYSKSAVKARFLTDSSVDFEILKSLLWKNRVQHLEKGANRTVSGVLWVLLSSVCCQVLLGTGGQAVCSRSHVQGACATES